MAGHSQFKNIMHRKGAQDAKRSKLFTKIIRELTVAAKMGGSDPEANPRLRTALINARTSNMGKETIERAIKRGAGGEESKDYQEIRYEGYGPGGSAILVETLTDNRNRTAPELRSLFSKQWGSLGEINSVSYLFDHVGVLVYPSTLPEDKLFEVAFAHEAQDMTSEDEGYTILCPMSHFTVLRDAMISHFGDPMVAKLAWIPQLPIQLPEKHRESFTKLIDILEDHDDVQHVWHAVQFDEIQ